MKDSGAVCQQLVQDTLADLEGVVAYIDDILIFVDTIEEHDNILRQVLCRLQAKDFRIQLSKCLFHHLEVPFLGRLISANGIRPDPKNVAAISKIPVPTTLKQTCSFLGTVTHYSQFMPDLADLAEPL